MKLLCLLLALFMVPAFPVQPTQDNMSATEYVTEHFDDFIAEYNNLDIEDCNATYIEFQKEINILDEGTTGYYLDFNDENGFCIVTGDTIVDMRTTGDYPELRQEGEFAYDIMDGFLQYIDGEYVQVIQPADASVEEEPVGSAEIPRAEIKNADDYIYTVYGASYKPYKSLTLPNFRCYSQNSFALYYKIQGNKILGEGNCVLSSVYTLLNHLRITGVYPNLPGTSTTVRTDTDVVRSKAAAVGYTPMSIRGKYIRTVPTLYVKIRQIAIEKYGYVADSGITTGKVDDLMRDVLAAYGYSGNVSYSNPLPIGNQQITTTPIEAAIKKVLDKGRPVLISTSLVYGEMHEIVVFGYETYRRVYTIAGVKLNRYAKLLTVADNHNACKTYFDYTRYSLSAPMVYIAP